MATDGPRRAGRSPIPPLLLAAGLLAGCQSTPWLRGGFEEGLPKLDRKLPLDMSFYVDKTEKRVRDAFRKALEEQGFALAEKEDEADVLLKTTVDSWEFNDAGFGGMGARRDDMELSVQLVDRRRKRVMARGRISVRSDFRIIAKYVETF